MEPGLKRGWCSEGWAWGAGGLGVSHDLPPQVRESRHGEEKEFTQTPGCGGWRNGAREGSGEHPCTSFWVPEVGLYPPPPLASSQGWRGSPCWRSELGVAPGQGGLSRDTHDPQAGAYPGCWRVCPPRSQIRVSPGSWSLRLRSHSPTHLLTPRLVSSL